MAVCRNQQHGIASQEEVQQLIGSTARNPHPPQPSTAHSVPPSDIRINDKEGIDLLSPIGRERHRSLSIQNLIDIPLIVHPVDSGNDPSQVKRRMMQPHNYSYEMMSTSDNASPLTIDSFSPTVPFNRFHGITAASTTSTSNIDSDSLASFADATQAVHTSSDKHQAYEVSGPYVVHRQDDLANVSPYVRAESRASSALSVLTTFSESSIDDRTGRHSAPHLTPFSNTTMESMHGLGGRARSDTARRYDSLASVESAPALSTAVKSSSLRSPSITSCMSFGGHVSDGNTAFTSTLIDSFKDDVRSESHAGAARKKRNKCSPEQLRQLEKFFSSNRNPTGKIREDLSRRIQMPERSVQVWFQNKRAKAKIIESRDSNTMEQQLLQKGSRTITSTPAQQRLSSSSDSSIARKTRKLSAIDVTAQSKTEEEESVLQLPVSSLCVGHWRRIMPLLCIFSRRNQSFSWFLRSESVGFKLECPRTSIRRITFTGPRDPTMHEFTEGVHTPVGMLTVELDRPPQFYMEVFRSSGAPVGETKEEDSVQTQKASWRQCVDFTEDKQATQDLSHLISGPYETLREAVLQLKQSRGAIGQMVEMHDADTHNGTLPGHTFYAGNTLRASGGEESESTWHNSNLSVHMPSSLPLNTAYDPSSHQDHGSASATGVAATSPPTQRWSADGRTEYHAHGNPPSAHLLQPVSAHITVEDGSQPSPGLGMGNLRIDVGKSFLGASEKSPLTTTFAAQREPGFVGSGTHQHVPMQWPQSAVASTSYGVGWMYAGNATTAGANAITNAADHANVVSSMHRSPSTSASGLAPMYGSQAATIASAPAFAFNSFESQQASVRPAMPSVAGAEMNNLYGAPPSSVQMAAVAASHSFENHAGLQHWPTPRTEYDPASSSATPATFAHEEGMSFSRCAETASNVNDGRQTNESSGERSATHLRSSGNAVDHSIEQAYPQDSSVRSFSDFRVPGAAEDVNVNEHSADTLMPRHVPL